MFSLDEAECGEIEGGEESESFHEEMKITVLYDTPVYTEGLEVAWGFSVLIEDGEKSILFDAGWDGGDDSAQHAFAWSQPAGYRHHRALAPALGSHWRSKSRACEIGPG